MNHRTRRARYDWQVFGLAGAHIEHMRRLGEHMADGFAVNVAELPCGQRLFEL
jgi:hypothetical protein